MPIYEYRCIKCEKSFEKFQRISEEPIKKCPDCNGKVERLISQTSFSLKGGGWYKDGYSSVKKESTKNKENKVKKEEKSKSKKNAEN